jgi:hypothetical protein
MNISIDEEILKKSFTDDDVKLTLEEALICIFIMKDFDIGTTLADLIGKGVVLKSNTSRSGWKVFQKYSQILESVIVASDKNAPKTESLDDLVEKLQVLFPHERKPDANGVPKYSYRGNKRDVLLKLQKFFKLYGNYSFDDVYECTKRYVESFKYDKTYMRILPYFIMKDGESQLATELENMEEKTPVIEDPNKDWTNTLL